MKKTYLIIGSSAAGSSAIKTLNSLDKDAEIICLTKENVEPYNKCNLVSYLADLKGYKNRRSLSLFDKSYFQINKNVTIIGNSEVIEIDVKNRLAKLKDGESFSYDKLLITTGASPIKPDSFDSLKKVFLLHTLNDFLKLKKYIKNFNVKNITIVGAGINGLETAWAIKQLDSKIIINLVEAKKKLLSCYLDSIASGWLESKIESIGINIFAENKLKNILEQKNNLLIELEDGIKFETEIVIFTLGVYTESGLIKDSEIKFNNGIIVNDCFKTNIDSIYAAGDCILTKNILTGESIINHQWTDAVIQGNLGAINMLGIEKKYPGIYPQLISNFFFNLGFAAFGHNILSQNVCNNKIVIKDKNNILNLFLDENDIIIGFVMIGNLKNFHQLKKRVIEKQKFE